MMNYSIVLLFVALLSLISGNEYLELAGLIYFWSISIICIIVGLIATYYSNKLDTSYVLYLLYNKPDIIAINNIKYYNILIGVCLNLFVYLVIVDSQFIYTSIMYIVSHFYVLTGLLMYRAKFNKVLDSME